MLRNLSVLPSLGGANFVRAGVADDLDESVHVLVITKLYEEFGDILGRPNTVTFTEKNHVVDVGCVKEDGAETQAALTHLATADEQVSAFAVDLHVYFGDATVVELAGFESPVPPLHGGLILLDVERVNMDGHKPEMHSNYVCKYVGWNVVNKALCPEKQRTQEADNHCTSVQN